MDFNELTKQFGAAVMLPLEPGDTDKNGNQYADHEAYEVEMQRQNDVATANLKKLNAEKPF